MTEVETREQFLAWAISDGSEIPFLVTWAPEPSSPFGILTVKVADPDYRMAWAQEPSSHRFSKDHVAYYGLQEFAGNFVGIMQDAHDVERSFEVQA